MPAGPTPETHNSEFMTVMAMILMFIVLGAMVMAILTAIIHGIIGFFQWKRKSAQRNANYKIWANVHFSFQQNTQQPTVAFQTYAHKLFESVDTPEFWKVYVKYHFEKKYNEPFLIEVDGKII